MKFIAIVGLCAGGHNSVTTDTHSDSGALLSDGSWIPVNSYVPPHAWILECAAAGNNPGIKTLTKNASDAELDPDNMDVSAEPSLHGSSHEHGQV